MYRDAWSIIIYSVGDERERKSEHTIDKWTGVTHKRSKGSNNTPKANMIIAARENEEGGVHDFTSPLVSAQ